MSKIRINLELIEQFIDFKRRINSTPLQDIEFFRGGKPVAVSAEEIEEWRFTGMSNLSFAEELAQDDPPDND